MPLQCHERGRQLHRHPCIQNVLVEFLRLLKPLFTIQNFGLVINAFEILLVPGETCHLVMS